MTFEMSRSAWLRLLAAAEAQQVKAIRRAPRHSYERSTAVELLDHIQRLRKAEAVRIEERI